MDEWIDRPIGPSAHISIDRLTDRLIIGRWVGRPNDASMSDRSINGWNDASMYLSIDRVAKCSEAHARAGAVLKQLARPLRQRAAHFY
eukprot:3254009-Lingulodinium_polyedra.AAC.1